MNEFRKGETLIQYHRRRLEELKEIRRPWEPIWQSLADLFAPERLRLWGQKEGPRTRKKIIDSTGVHALDVLKSGMHSGLTSPSRPWFRLGAPSQIKKRQDVKQYCADVQEKMRTVFSNSNLYRSFHVGYGDLGLFGQSVAILVEDVEDVIRLQQLVHGRFWIARDHKGKCITLYRVFKWSVQRIVDRFGYDNCPNRIKSLFDTNKYGELIDVYHAIEPRSVRDPGKLDKKNKAFLSNYWTDETGSGLLEESGFDTNPIIAPAWELGEDDHYSISPAMKVLSDLRMLQTEQTRKLEGIDRKVRPPMNAPTSMRNTPGSLLPGAVNYVDDPTGAGFRPSVLVNIDLNELREDIKEVQQRVEVGMYADLFFAISNMEGVQPRNQFELNQRQEEKLLQLGPVLENVFGDQLGPVIDRAFDILAERHELPMPPSDLQGQPLKTEYISTLAQAQQAVATGAMERGLAFAGQLSQAKPEVLDKIEGDEALELYWEAIGAPPSMLAADDKVEQIRSDRAQQMQAQAEAEQAATIAPAVRDTAQAASVMADANNNPQGDALLQQLGVV